MVPTARHNTDFLKRRSLRLMDLLDNLIHIIAQPRHQNPLRDRRKKNQRTHDGTLPQLQPVFGRTESG